MRSLFFVILTLWSIQAMAARTVAVLPLAKGAGPAQYDGLGTALAGMIVSDLSTVESLQLVERERLGALVAEMKLSASEFVDPATAQKLGQGLGAELVVTGSFSVVQDTFVMDTRLVRVASGEVVKAARADGPVKDFVAIEKGVVEGLIDGLQVQLSLGSRRALMVQTPTEDAAALASYGRGLDAEDAGDVAAAQAAYRQALVRDPRFRLASLALADLKQTSVDLVQTERQRRRTSVDEARLVALEHLVPETTRDESYEDDLDSVIDLSIRLVLLGRTKQHCQRYAELKHYVLRTQWQGKHLTDYSNKRKNEAAFAEVRARFDSRGHALGLVGERKPVNDRPGEMFHNFSRGVSTASEMVLGRGLNTHKLRNTAGSALAACHEPPEQVEEWKTLMADAERAGVMDDALHNSTELTVRDGLELHLAYLQASNTGVDAGVQAAVQRVVDRHPDSPSERASVLAAMAAVVRAGEARERRIASRMGMSAQMIRDIGASVLAEDGEVLRLDNPVCKGIVTSVGRYLGRSVDADREAALTLDKHKTEASVDRVAGDLAPVVMARCVASANGEPLSISLAFELVRAGLERPHPARLGDEPCVKRIKALTDNVTQDRQHTVTGWGAAAHSSQVLSLLLQLNGLRTGLCVLP